MSEPIAKPVSERPNQAIPRSAFTILVIGACLFALGIAGLLVLSGKRGTGGGGTSQAHDLPKTFAAIPDFALTERSGRAVTKGDLLGKVCVVGFIFTRCHQTCPMVTGVMAKLRSELPSEVQLVSVSVDPRYDLPDVLTEYARNYRADPNTWWFLTGDEQTVYRLIRDGFRLPVQANPDPKTVPGELVSHTTRLAVLDRQGNVRGYFDSSDPAAMSLLARKVKQLREEPE